MNGSFPPGENKFEIFEEFAACFGEWVSERELLKQLQIGLVRREKQPPYLNVTMYKLEYAKLICINCLHCKNQQTVYLLSRSTQCTLFKLVWTFFFSEKQTVNEKCCGWKRFCTMHNNSNNDTVAELVCVCARGLDKTFLIAWGNVFPLTRDETKQTHIQTICVSFEPDIRLTSIRENIFDDSYGTKLNKTSRFSFVCSFFGFRAVVNKKWLCSFSGDSKLFRGICCKQTTICW